MRVLRPVLLLSLVSVFLGDLSAQQPVQRDPQALQILTQSYSAMTAARVAVQDTMAVGTISRFDGATGPVVLKTKDSDKFRSEITLGGSQLLAVVSRGKGHGQREGQAYSLPAWATKYARPSHIPALSRLADFVRPNMNIVYLSLANVNGRPAHEIRMFASPQGKLSARIEEMISEVHVFLDTQTLLLVKTLTYDFSPDIVENRTLVETYYSDYRSVDGLMVPHNIVRVVAGQKLTEIVLTSVRLNVGLRDTDFQ